jgi:hypothetical protein
MVVWGNSFYTSFSMSRPSKMSDSLRHVSNPQAQVLVAVSGILVPVTGRTPKGRIDALSAWWKDEAGTVLNWLEFKDSSASLPPTGLTLFEAPH